MTKNLGKTASQGVLWNLLNQGCQQAVQFAIVIILARLLEPADFGVFGMAVIFSAFLNALRQWGFQAYLIQKKDINDADKDTAFWAIAVMGLLIFSFCFLSAPWVGRFFHDARVGDVVRVLAFTSLLTPLGAVQWAIVTRELKFKSLMLRNVLAAVVYGAVAVCLAFKGWGVWALVWAAMAREVVWSVLFWVICDWRPHFRFSVEKMKVMLRFSFGCIGSGTLNYVMDNVDAAIVGKCLGPANLGQYNLAMNLVSQPQIKLVSNISSVAFPVFSQLQDSLQRMQEYYIKTLRVIFVAVTPIFAILFASAHDFIVTVYGPKWEPAVIPVKIMCMYGLIKTLFSITEPVFLSRGKSGAFFMINVFRFMAVIPCLLVGVRYGIEGVSWAILFYSMVTAIPLLVGAHRLLQLSAQAFLDVCWRYCFVFWVIAGAIYVGRSSLALTPGLGLLWSVLVGAGAFVIGMVLVNRDDISALADLLKKAFVK